MIGWLDDLHALIERGREAVLVTVVAAEGSTPRETGTKMIVTADDIVGTIGGGNLEYRATGAARDMLADGTRVASRDFPLGPSLGQCCGGHTTLFFEKVDENARDWVVAARRAGEPTTIVTRLDCGDKRIVGGDRIVAGTLGAEPLDHAADREANSPGTDSVLVTIDEIPILIDRLADAAVPVVLFGAGHVGRAIVHVLAPLPDFRVTWVDNRPGMLPDDLPAVVRAVETDDPAGEIDDIPPGAIVLVMTHSHALDYDIVERALVRGDTRYLGLIGSATKRARFEQRWRHRGGAAAALDRLTSPIGIAGVSGKHPATIAVAVTAEILMVRDRPWTEARKELSA